MAAAPSRGGLVLVYTQEHSTLPTLQQPLSTKYGSYQAVKAKFWPGFQVQSLKLSGERPWNFPSPFRLAQKRTGDENWVTSAHPRRRKTMSASEMIWIRRTPGDSSREFNTPQPWTSTHIRFEGLLPRGQRQNLAVTVFNLPHSLSG